MEESRGALVGAVVRTNIVCPSRPCEVNIMTPGGLDCHIRKINLEALTTEPYAINGMTVTRRLFRQRNSVS